MVDKRSNTAFGMLAKATHELLGLTGRTATVCKGITETVDCSLFIFKAAFFRNLVGRRQRDQYKMRARKDNLQISPTIEVKW